MMWSDANPVWIFVSAFGLSAFAGLSALLGLSKKKVTALAVFSAMLHGGLMGLAACLWWYNDYAAKHNVPGLIGLCILLGLGGWPMTTFILDTIYKGGLKIVVKDDHDPK
jgi:succinate-acetate transporter protein